jgi:hypothetical protein
MPDAGCEASEVAINIQKNVLVLRWYTSSAAGIGGMYPVHRWFWGAAPKCVTALSHVKLLSLLEKDDQN